MKKDPGGVLQQKVREQSSKIKDLEEEKLSLAEDKTQLVGDWLMYGLVVWMNGLID